jgi:predicted phosphate transport protein (TIGR00153 family)
VRLRITPRDTSFFDLFSKSASYLVSAAELLSQILGADKSTRKQLAARLDELEHACDATTHEILRKMHSTFVTPLDREDIYALAAGLDDCMDLMEEAGDLIVLYKLNELPPGVTNMVAVLQRCAEITAISIPRMKTMDDLEEYWIEINRLENQADKLHRKLLAKLFDDHDDCKLIMKLKEVIEVLEEAADAFESLANTVEAVTIKES